jgi:hypothetical protein
MRRRPPDTRPRWNDPDLPCVRDYKMRDGKRVTEVDADYERRYREFMMETGVELHFRHDPTYNMRRKHGDT